jgi:uncharacterized OB-fold protein
VLTYTVNRQQWLPALPPPYVIAVVGLDDDPDLRVTSRVVDVGLDEICIGMRIRVHFERCADIWLPLFVPDRELP